MQRACKQCGVKFKTTDKRRKFCSVQCCWQWRRENDGAGRFKAGITPWNTGTKGVMKANSGTFKKGQISQTKEVIGAVKIRKDKAGRSRAWVKVADKGNSYDWRMRAVMEWEKANGRFPAGNVIHHMDADTLNDEPGNLILMTRAEHINAHRDDLSGRKRDARACVACQ